jgi:hypothetical protein
LRDAQRRHRTRVAKERNAQKAPTL